MKYAYFALPIALLAGLFFFFNSDDALTSDPQGPLQVLSNHNPKLQVAIVAGGCFWGVEEIIRKLPGIKEVKVGYIGGTIKAPTYDKVRQGDTGYAEAVWILFDPKELNYGDILHMFFRLHDPTTLNQQGNDIGTQYRSAIFYTTPEQQATAERIKQEVDQSHKWPRPLTTQIVPASEFYEAESYHQDYLQKHPNGYTCHYLRN